MDRLRKLRREFEVRQADLAKHMNISQGTLSLWENGKIEPDLTSLSMLAEYFCVSVDYLLGKSNIPRYAPLDIPESLQGAKAGFHRSEFEELTQDEVDALALIADKLKAARKNAKQ